MIEYAQFAKLADGDMRVVETSNQLQGANFFDSGAHFG
jgi:hypothetical protein